MKLTPQEARNFQERLAEIAAEIRAAAESLLTATDKAAGDKKTAQAPQEQANHEQETK